VELARQMIDAGADLVVGGHPHVVQPVEEYHGRWIAYSLGNFVFDQKSPGTHRGLMLKVKITGKEISEVIPVPIDIDRSFQASLAPEEEPEAKAARTARIAEPAAARAQ
jgi:poly-gamma-glutamate synthesis protein (capsule biosynthesis protein)